jgi:uncharacterized protein YbjT (DUF2867 family)
MTMRIAVAGATGRVGRHVVDVLAERGHDVVPISRATGVDVVTGRGLAPALEGVDAIVDAATGPSPDEREATAFFEAAGRNLQDAGGRAGASRIVVASIIGCDLFAGGYGRAKVVHERISLAGPVPARILRASQFHEFVEQLVAWGTRDGVAHVTAMRMQPVAARAVAEAVADMATDPGGDAAEIGEIAGPREERFARIAELLVARLGDSVRIEEAAGPSDPYASLHETGALLPGPGALLAGPTFEEWLDATYPVALSRATR